MSNDDGVADDFVGHNLLGSGTLDSTTFQFTRSARKHKIGRTAAREALIDAGEPVLDNEGRLVWFGSDARGRELHIVGVPLPDEQRVLIIHVMPAAFLRADGQKEGTHGFD